VIKRSLQDVSASIHQRLLNIAKETGRPFNELLQYFAMERFLFRLSRSTHAKSFVLKGALLFRAWDTPDSRATRDIDFLAYVDNSLEIIANIIRDICATADPSDGLSFDAESVVAQRIKEDADYEGVRVRFMGQLGNARIHMQVDVGFGDLIHPGAVQVDYPTLLELAAPSLRTYTPESVIAEKSQAMVHLGSLNSRMKDFYDIWRMSRQFDFQGETLREAIQRTFNNRGTEFVVFEELVQELLESEDIKTQWLAFRRKVPVEAPDSFADVLESISELLTPVFATIIAGQALAKHWKALGPWFDD
jgi:predicted nucleotidyltransferase component of viral defense system